jgi:hypothetical protein
VLAVGYRIPLLYPNALTESREKAVLGEIQTDRRFQRVPKEPHRTASTDYRASHAAKEDDCVLLKKSARRKIHDNAGCDPSREAIVYWLQ